MIITVFWLIGFVIAISVHEAAHAWIANKLGDPTAKLQGRLTLNPLKHYDPVGTVLLPLLLIFVHSPFIFGWAKPVIFDPYNLKNPRRDAGLISIAGPAANLAVAVIFSVAVRLLGLIFLRPETLQSILIPLVAVNVILSVFNLIPIHPLDGGKILVALLSEETALKVDRFLNQYGLLILLFLILPLFGNSLLITLISPTVNLILKILLPENLLI